MTKAEIGQRREKVIAYVREHPGCSRSEVAEATGIPADGVTGTIRGLHREGAIRTEGATVSRRYFPASAALAPADESGAKTDLERKVLLACAEPRSTGAIAQLVRKQEAEVATILSALETRGVVERGKSKGVAVWKATEA